jgi:hypothetical protein
MGLCADNEQLMAIFTADLVLARAAAVTLENMKPPEGVVDNAFEHFRHTLYNDAIEKLRYTVKDVEQVLGTSIFVDVPKSERLDELLGYMGWISFPLEDDPKQHLRSDTRRRKRRAAG